MSKTSFIFYSVWTLSSGGWYQHSEKEEYLDLARARLADLKVKFPHRPDEHFKIRRHTEIIEDYNGLKPPMTPTKEFKMDFSKFEIDCGRWDFWTS